MQFLRFDQRVEIRRRGGVNCSISPVDQATNDGATPLHIAAATRHSFAVVQTLVECGADVSIVDKHGDTPLRVAVTVKNMRVAEWLSVGGAPGLPLRAEA